MQNLLRFLATYYHFLLFVVLESIALSSLVRFNNHHRSVFFSTTSSMQGTVYQWQDDITSYFHLKEANQALLEENMQLRQKDSVLNMYFLNHDSTGVKDSTGILIYSYRTAEVINNSIFKRRNYFTINKGSAEGVKLDMGVLTPDGIAGKIVNVSEHFSLAMSVLHEDFIITPKIDGRTIYGGMIWEGENPEELKINRVNAHYDIQTGDTVLTSSHSHFFPPNIVIGKVDRFQKTDDNYQEVWVKLSVDIGQIQGVYVVQNHFMEEVKKLEELDENEPN